VLLDQTKLKKRRLLGSSSSSSLRVPSSWSVIIEAAARHLTRQQEVDALPPPQ
jgi:hypothetical protein